MKWRSFLLTATLAITSLGSYAQANLLNAKLPEEIGVKTDSQKEADNDAPLKYGYVDDRDMLWSKMVWETIDLDERVNFPLYYPIDTIDIGANRRSLYDVLVKNIKSGKLKDIYVDSYFTEKRSFNDLKTAMVKIDTSDLGFEQLNAGESVSAEYITRTEITAQDVEAWRIKGVWYFDKRQGEMKYRLLGIAPAVPDVNFLDDENPALVELFWVWYPSAREILHEAKAFNHRNTSMPISFDHILNARRFNALIYKEDNVYGDRLVTDYITENSLFQLLESDKIKDKIRNFEQDMWTY